MCARPRQELNAPSPPRRSLPFGYQNRPVLPSRYHVCALAGKPATVPAHAGRWMEAQSILDVDWAFAEGARRRVVAADVQNAGLEGFDEAGRTKGVAAARLRHLLAGVKIVQADGATVVSSYFDLLAYLVLLDAPTDVELQLVRRPLESPGRHGLDRIVTDKERAEDKALDARAIRVKDHRLSRRLVQDPSTFLLLHRSFIVCSSCAPHSRLRRLGWPVDRTPPLRHPLRLCRSVVPWLVGRLLSLLLRSRSRPRPRRRPRGRGPCPPPSLSCSACGGHFPPTPAVGWRLET